MDENEEKKLIHLFPAMDTVCLTQVCFELTILKTKQMIQLININPNIAFVKGLKFLKN